MDSDLGKLIDIVVAEADAVETETIDKLPGTDDEIISIILGTPPAKLVQLPTTK